MARIVSRERSQFLSEKSHVSQGVIGGIRLWEVRRIANNRESGGHERLGENVGRANQTTKKPRDGTPITAHRAFTLVAHHASARVLTCVRTSALCYILSAPSGGTFYATNRWRAAMPGGVSIASLLLGYGHDRRWRFLSCRS